MIVCVILLLLPAHSPIIGRKRSSFSSTNTLSGSNFLTLSSRGNSEAFEEEKWKTSVRRTFLTCQPRVWGECVCVCERMSACVCEASHSPPPSTSSLIPIRINNLTLHKVRRGVHWMILLTTHQHGPPSIHGHHVKAKNNYLSTWF